MHNHTRHHVRAEVKRGNTGDMHSQLEEIIANGGADQARLARELMARLSVAPDESPALLAEIGALYDAYLHDPYLTRENR